MEEYENTTVDILGSTWKIIFKDDDPAFEECKGYNTFATRTIVIEKPYKPEKPLDYSIEEQEIAIKSTIRHEILHAFLSESGLDDSSLKCKNWAVNEEMVDWFAIQSPKIFKVYKELKLI